MFTDIKGYSSLMSKDEAGTLAFLKIHNENLRARIAFANGVVVKTIGDAFMVDFPNSQAAAEAAVAIQEDFHAFNSTRDRGAKRFIRIGIHAGDVESIDGDLFGENVNIAARLEPLSPPGGIHLSADTVERLTKRGTWTLKSAGSSKLKNIKKPVRTFYLTTPNMDPRAGIRPRKGVHPLVWLLGIGIAGAGAYFGWPYFDRALENSRWRLVEELDLSKDRHEELMAAGAPWKMNSVDLSQRFPAYHFTDGYAWLAKALPRRAYRIEVDFYRGTRENSSLAIFAASDLKNVPTGMGVPGQDPFKRPAMGAEFQWRSGGTHQRTQIHEILSDNRSVGLWSGHDSPYKAGIKETVVFTLDADFAKVSVHGWHRGRALIRNFAPIPSKTVNIGIHAARLEIAAIRVLEKKKSTKLDLEEAASTYWQEGQFDLAAKVFNDLSLRAENREVQNRFAYKTAAVYRASGNPGQAAEILRKLAQEPGPGLYPGYAAFDLAFALSSSNQGAQPAENDAREAEALFQKLLAFQPPHPEYSRARYFRFLNLLNNLRQMKAAAAAVQPILEDRDDDLYVDAVLRVSDHSVALGFAKPEEFLRQQMQKNIGNMEAWKGIHDRLLDLLKRGGIWGQYLEELSLEMETFPAHLEMYPRAAWRVIDVLQQVGDGSNILSSSLDRIEKNPIQAQLFYRQILKFNVRSILDWRARNYMRVRIQIAGSEIKFSEREALEVSGATSTGSSIQPRPSIAGGSVGYDFDTGTAWGCGLVVPLQRITPKAGLPNDLSGFGGVAFDFRLPVGTSFHASFSEVGNGPADLPYDVRPSSADGEEYFGILSIAEGDTWRRCVIRFNDLDPQLYWGNQFGNQTLDLAALESLKITIRENQGKGRFELSRLEALPLGDPELRRSTRPSSLAFPKSWVRFRERPPFPAAPLLYFSHKMRGSKALVFGSIEGGNSIKVAGDGTIRMRYDSGESWGGGLTIFPRKQDLSPTPGQETIDLAGFNAMSFRARAPAGFKFNVFMNELGSHANGDGLFPVGKDGVDGEAYVVVEACLGSGDWKTYSIDLVHASQNPLYGNPRGNRTLDLQGIIELGFSFKGHQGRGTLELREIKFSRHPERPAGGIAQPKR